RGRQPGRAAPDNDNVINLQVIAHPRTIDIVRRIFKPLLTFKSFQRICAAERRKTAYANRGDS
ncbi:hypothetical protein, partial [Bradyrhizobium ivorense]|uniref:hypothetical protein n=1 Tax=Bradyrhizobium ivorense TaxID=2511166 RepID=UPI001E5F8A03